MIGKLIVQAGTRLEAINRMKWALDQFVIQGPATTIPFAAKIMNDPDFVKGEVDTKWLERNYERFKD